MFTHGPKETGPAVLSAVPSVALVRRVSACRRATGDPESSPGGAEEAIQCLSWRRGAWFAPVTFGCERAGAGGALGGTDGTDRTPPRHRPENQSGFPQGQRSGELRRRAIVTRGAAEFPPGTARADRAVPVRLVSGPLLSPAAPATPARPEWVCLNSRMEPAAPAVSGSWFCCPGFTANDCKNVRC